MEALEEKVAKFELFVLVRYEIGGCSQPHHLLVGFDLEGALNRLAPRRQVGSQPDQEIESGVRLGQMASLYLALGRYSCHSKSSYPSFTSD